jgi:hypothetical protein
MKIALIPGSFKPYHAGHDALIQKAVNENDKIIVYYSTADRARAGELAITGEASSRIMQEFVANTLSENVMLVASKVPVRSVFEILAEVDGTTNDSYTIYADSEDISRFQTLSKYAPKLTAAKKITLKSMTRGKDSPQISGTLMREFIMSRQTESFARGLPPGLKPHASELIQIILGDSNEGQKKSKDSFKTFVLENFHDDSKSRRATDLRTSESKIKLLEELVSSLDLLLEFDGEGYSGYDSWSAGGPSALKKAFIDPFLNVGKALKATGLDVLNAASIPLRAVALKLTGSPAALETAFNGYLSSKKKIQKIWEPVKKFNDEALGDDASVFMFALSPKLYVTKVFAQAGLESIAGKSGSSDTGLIGALASSGLLPSSLAESWKDFKEDRPDEERIQFYKQGVENKIQREKAKSRLLKLVPELGSIIGGAAVLDGNKELNRKYALQLDYRDIDNLRNYVEDNFKGSKKDESNNLIEQINQYTSIYGRSMRSFYRYRAGDAVDKMKNIKAPEELRAAVASIMNSSYDTLRESTKRYLPLLQSIGVLNRSKSVKDFLGNIGQIEGAAEIKKVTDDLVSKIKSSKKFPDNAIDGAVLSVLKKEFADEILNNQNEIVRRLREVEQDMAPIRKSKDLVRSSEEVRDLLEQIDETKKLFGLVASQLRVDGNVTDDLLNALEKNSKAIESRSRKS